MVEEIKKYSLFPIIAASATYILLSACGYTVNEKYTLKLLLDFSSEFENSPENVIAFLNINFKIYLIYLALVIAIAFIYFLYVFPKLVIEQFLEDKPSEAATLEHFPLLIQVATSLLKPEEPILNIDLVDTYNNLYSGKLASFKCNKSGNLESLVLTNTVRITKADKSLGTIVQHPIPGSHMFFFAKDIMNINISQWGVVKKTSESENISELFVDMSDEELTELLADLDRHSHSPDEDD